MQSSLPTNEMSKLGILNGQYPRFVYKYRAINGFTVDIFKKIHWLGNVQKLGT